MPQPKAERYRLWISNCNSTENRDHFTKVHCSVRIVPFSAVRERIAFLRVIHDSPQHGRVLFFSNLPERPELVSYWETLMSESISAEDGRRAPRVKLAGVVLALIQLENGRQIRSRLHQLSITGGLLYLDDPLDEGIKVEVMFHVGNCTVRSKAAMLFPMWATQGCLQPFEFTDLAEDDRRTLESDLGTFLGQSSSAATIEEKSLGAAAGRDN